MFAVFLCKGQTAEAQKEQESIGWQAPEETSDSQGNDVTEVVDGWSA